MISTTPLSPHFFQSTMTQNVLFYITLYISDWPLNKMWKYIIEAQRANRLKIKLYFDIEIISTSSHQ